MLITTEAERDGTTPVHGGLSSRAAQEKAVSDFWGIMMAKNGGVSFYGINPTKIGGDGSTAAGAGA